MWLRYLRVAYLYDLVFERFRKGEHESLAADTRTRLVMVKENEVVFVSKLG